MDNFGKTVFERYKKLFESAESEYRPVVVTGEPSITMLNKSDLRPYLEKLIAGSIKEASPLVSKEIRKYNKGIVVRMPIGYAMMARLELGSFESGCLVLSGIINHMMSSAVHNGAFADEFAGDKFKFYEFQELEHNAGFELKLSVEFRE